ncbi:class I SAM-dependent methyltransferase [Candidatus Uhrbacteria bacterium]|nr:class I SAM-dependent methyltransferase [Candidatus Uhrbacteria bacterium]
MNLWFATLLEAALIIFLIFMLVYAVYSLFATISFAPYVHSGKKKILTMLDLANVEEGMTILDLGSGNGDLCILAATRGANAVGLEINPLLVWLSNFKSKRKDLTDKATFVRADLWHYRFPDMTQVVFVYGMPEKMRPLWTKLKNELRPGTRIISHAFSFPEVSPEKEVGNVRMYRL